MKDRSHGTLKGIGGSVRSRMVSGLLALAPVGVTLLVMRWLIGSMAGFLRPLAESGSHRLLSVFGIQGIDPALLKVPLMVISMAGFLLVVYLAGALTQAVIGRRLIRAGEAVLMKVPLANTIYSAAKQVTEAIAMPTRSALRTVVLVEFPRKGIWSVGFLTGNINDGRAEMAKVFVPTTPNPTSGFFLILPSRDMVVTTLTVEEAFKMIISGGIVSPSVLGVRASASGIREGAPPGECKPGA